MGMYNIARIVKDKIVSSNDELVMVLQEINDQKWYILQLFQIIIFIRGHSLVRNALIALSVFHFMNSVISFSYFLKSKILLTSLRLKPKKAKPTVPTIIPLRMAYFQYLSFFAIRASSRRGFAISLRILNFLARRARPEEMSRYLKGLVMIPDFSLSTCFKSYSANINNYSRRVCCYDIFGSLAGSLINYGYYNSPTQSRDDYLRIRGIL